MDSKELKEYMEIQFVEDYNDIKQFMVNVNEKLEQIGFDKKYENYNEFCVDIADIGSRS